ncbi:MAG: GGDEF domain-containing protein [Clostridia bacterium]|nr:GGDEF domain-containing protein [Clostridia bacterium]
MDHFKAVNDLEGHLIGDKVLRDFVNFIREQVPGVMAMIRLGGDEFIAIFQSGETADAVSESLRQARIRYEAVHRQHGNLSFRMGIGRLGEKMDAALGELDQLMYEDKQRNQT